MTQPIIDYPCPWSYRIIGRDEQLMRLAVAGEFAQQAYSLTTCNISRAGKYVSLNFEIIVTDDDFRKSVFEALRGLPPVVFVL